MTTQWWRLGFGFPVVNSLLSFLFCLLIAKKDSVYFLMDEGDLNGARFQFQRIYIFPNGDLEFGFEELKKEREKI